MKAFKITLYIACVVIGIQQASETIACGASCVSRGKLTECNTNLDNCNNQKAIEQTITQNAYTVASKNSVDLLENLVNKFNSEKSESCDGKNNSFGCPADKVISILHGSYGFISNHGCTTDIQTDICIAPREQVMSWIPTWCEGAQNCTILWVNDRPDPCQFTSKVLSIYYFCVAPPSQG